MIANRFTVPEKTEPPQAGGADVPWVEVRGKRILLVEDEELLRGCLRMMLEHEGHQVTEAANGAEALNLYRMGVFDLVITDFEMPVMEGNELAVGIKQLSPSLPILMISASESARLSVDNPVDALLSKPFTSRDLHSALGKLLSARLDPAQPGTVPVLQNSCASFVPERELAVGLQA